ncbi:hypothetical protein KL86PLE_41111 [uncultured Pleomorphomonas sp.]|uniref:Uncharacterized protein n=1 Tax=uncultured Pleomorphomonas sp. TaxID=442121 RepID=A0A212LID0_9HYPH|nr:hypothetical protein [uncultured Pleomorphomonas sp.]SCM77306.1 hypothetical protein KL86PLE_41111 [uncultured Pleomorphomonas sp.]
MDPENALRIFVSEGILFHSGQYRPVKFGLAPMSILIVFAGVAYLAIGLGFTVLSLHELATSRRDRLFNRLMAWSNVLLWLPTLIVVAASAFFASLRPTHPQVPAMAARRDAGLGERRAAARRAVRQI